LFRNPNNGVASAADEATGEGCYVTATVNNRRYYGVLIDQAALQSASMLHFQEESSGLDLNRRMMTLSQLRKQSSINHSDNKNREQKLPATPSSQNVVPDSRKRPRNDFPDLIPSESTFGRALHETPLELRRQVQKLRFVSGDDATQGYRELLATFADACAAAEEDDILRRQIETACQSGGDFVGKYYFQFEVRRCVRTCCSHRD